MPLSLTCSSYIQFIAMKKEWKKENPTPKLLALNICMKVVWNFHTKWGLWIIVKLYSCPCKKKKEEKKRSFKICIVSVDTYFQFNFVPFWSTECNLNRGDASSTRKLNVFLNSFSPYPTITNYTAVNSKCLKIHTVFSLPDGVVWTIQVLCVFHSRH